MRRATALAFPVRRLSDLFIAMSVQFTFKMCVTAGNCKNSFKTLKTYIFEVQKHPRSSILTPLNSSSLVLVMITAVGTYVCVYLQLF